jgi:hypothetical protein
LGEFSPIEICLHNLGRLLEIYERSPNFLSDFVPL